MSLDLPFSVETNSHQTAFSVVQRGSGPAATFHIANSSSSNYVLLAGTTGSGVGVWGATESGVGVRGDSDTGWAAFFYSSRSSRPVLETLSDGTGDVIVARTQGANGRAGFFSIEGATNGQPALAASTRGSGAVLHANHLGRSGVLALFQVAGANRIRFSRSGKGFFNGGTQTGGADVAEAFQAEGEVAEYGPGDVLVISERSDRRVEMSADPYSTRVIGVYATKPGVLLTERGIDESLDDMVPVGVVGVIPTRVSAENGAIRRGDLLVTAGTPGHAMRGTDREHLIGAIVGKAMEAFEGPGAGMIRVMVNVK